MPQPPGRMSPDQAPAPDTDPAPAARGAASVLLPGEKMDAAQVWQAIERRLAGKKR